MNLGNAGQRPRPQWERDLMDYQRASLDRIRSGLHPWNGQTLTAEERVKMLQAEFPRAVDERGFIL
jgi:hypothetical protein